MPFHDSWSIFSFVFSTLRHETENSLQAINVILRCHEKATAHKVCNRGISSVSGVWRIYFKVVRLWVLRFAGKCTNSNTKMYNFDKLTAAVFFPFGKSHQNACGRWCVCVCADENGLSHSCDQRHCRTRSANCTVFSHVSRRRYSGRNSATH